MDGASTFGRYVCGGILSSVCAYETSQSAIFMDSGLCEQYVKSILVANCTSYLDPLSEMDRSNTSIASLKAVTLSTVTLALTGCSPPRIEARVSALEGTHCDENTSRDFISGTVGVDRGSVILIQ